MAMYAAVQRRLRDYRVSLLISTTIWGVVVVLITESLSLFHWIGKAGIATAWLAITAMAIGAACLSWRRSESQRSSIDSIRPGWAMLSVCILLGVELGLLGIVSLTVPPNSDDALAYHMPRVLHWLQNHSVGHFPTTIQRQTYLAPWSSYAVLQFQALLDNDYLANGVQWCSMVVAVIGASLIARELGANSSGQILAAALAGSLPIAVLQSTTAENHLAVTCWLVCFVWFALSALNPAISKSQLHFFMCMAGLALGLAILTKGTAYIVAPPFCAWLAWPLFRRLRLASMLPLILLAALALTLNLPEYVRQARTYGSPLGPGGEPAYLSRAAESYGNLTHTPTAVISNIMRNIAIELGTPSAILTSAVDQTVRTLHRWMGIDINDPRTTWNDGQFSLLPKRWINEIFAGNPLHFLLITLACAYILIRFRKSRAWACTYVCSLICAWVLFSIVLRWNPWLTRLHMPILILGTPLAGVALYQFGGRWTSFAVGMLVLLLAIPYTVLNIDRPLIGPKAYYSRNRTARYYLEIGPEIEEIHRLMVNLAVTSGSCDSVGLKLGRDDAEYAILMLFRERGMTPTFQHVGVQNASTKYYSSLPPFKPDVVFIVRQSESEFNVVRDVPSP